MLVESASEYTVVFIVYGKDLVLVYANLLGTWFCPGYSYYCNEDGYLDFPYRSLFNLSS